jgi:hypothetical protein
MGLKVWHPSGRYIDVDDDTSRAQLTPDELVGLLRQHVAQWIEEGKFDFAASAVFRYTWHKSDRVAAVANLCMAQIAIAHGNPLAARFHLDRAECLGIPAADQDWYQQLLDQSKNYVTEPGERFKPHNTHLNTFTHDILVKCPKCGAGGSVQHSGVWSAPTAALCAAGVLETRRGSKAVPAIQRSAARGPVGFGTAAENRDPARLAVGLQQRASGPASGADRRPVPR